jgi:hypothetical protein
MNKSLEKRRHPRYEVLEHSFAVSKNHNTSSYFMGQVVDISEEGLSFVYMKDFDQPAKTDTISVFSTGWGFWFEEFAAKQVSEYEIAECGFFNRIVMIKRGIQFGILPDEKVIELKRLIEKIQAEKDRKKNLILKTIMNK